MLKEMVIDGCDFSEDGVAVDPADEALVRVASGDRQAFAALYDMLSSRAFGLIRRVLVDHAQSEEVLQDVFLEVWQQAPLFGPRRGSARSWVLTFAHRRAVDRVRSEQAGADRESRYGAATVEPPVDQVADRVLDNEDYRQVTQCLGALTDKQRECIELAYYDGLTYVQVSDRLSANLATIKSRMRDAIRGLRNCLGAA